MWNWNWAKPPISNLVTWWLHGFSAEKQQGLFHDEWTFSVSGVAAVTQLVLLPREELQGDTSILASISFPGFEMWDNMHPTLHTQGPELRMQPWERSHGDGSGLSPFTAALWCWSESGSNEWDPLPAQLFRDIIRSSVINSATESSQMEKIYLTLWSVSNLSRRSGVWFYCFQPAMFVWKISLIRDAAIYRGNCTHHAVTAHLWKCR